MALWLGTRHGFGKGSLGAGSRDMISSSGRWIIHQFWLVWFLPQWQKSTGMAAGGLNSRGLERNWDGFGLGKGPGRQNPERGRVLLAGRSLTISCLCGLGLPGWRLLGIYMILRYPSISEDSPLCYKNDLFYDNKILDELVITFWELNLLLFLFL